ncbi:MAG: HEAT repeat domain-containing protein [Acidobacteriia bacterium]|nr:HEAT repeat domain-containing protein [Terriglobia bacterium]
MTFNEGFFPAPSSGAISSAYAYSPGAPLSDKIAAELGFAIESAGTAHIPQLSLLQYHLLDDLNSTFVEKLYQRLSESAIVQQEILGLSGLIRNGSAAALTTAAQGESGFQSFALENGILLQSIRDRFRATDANSVSALGKATTSSSYAQDFRRATAHALAAIHSIGSLPYLVALFDDPDPDLRVEAIGGISAFANGLPVQSPANVASMGYLQPSSNSYRTTETIGHFAMGSRAIEQNEASYLAFWKNWWSQNRASLGY